MTKRATLPSYPSCARCGELRRAALHVSGGRVLCLNCSDRQHRRGACSQCFTVGPIEGHHPFGRDAERLVACHQDRELLITHAALVLAVLSCQDVTEPLCLNCHAVVSARQAEPRYAAAKRRKTHG